MSRTITLLMLVLCGSLAGCGAEPDSRPSTDDTDDTEETLSLATPPERACTCGDHPKPGYNCNSYDIINGACWCFYGLKTPTNGGN